MMSLVFPEPLKMCISLVTMWRKYVSMLVNKIHVYINWCMLSSEYNIVLNMTQNRLRLRGFNEIKRRASG